jgi:hypothetical protein
MRKILTAKKKIKSNNNDDDDAPIFGHLKLFKAPFEKVPWIAKKMMAYMKGGYVYLEDEHIPIIMTSHFRKLLQ